MNRHHVWRTLKRAVIVTALVGAAGLETSAVSAATLSYSEARVNSLSSVLDSEVDILRDDTGSEVELGVAGSRAAGFSASGGIVVKQVTDDVFARSSLVTGTVKARAVLQLGNNTFVSGGGVPLGTRNGAASATATFADSFRTYSGATPFLWGDGTSAVFRFGVTGQSTVTGTVPDPVDSSPGQPLDHIYTLLTINVYKPGTIELLRQQQDFDFGAYPDFSTALAAFTALTNQIQANLITRDYWYFGNVIAPYDVDPSKVLAIDPSTPTLVEFAFAPGGDFDWVASLHTNVFLDASLQSVGATLDFSNSIVTDYAGPAGTTTYSGSGLFPNTVPLSQAPVPCPRTQGFWRGHSDAWPVSSLTLGSVSYTKAQLLTLLGNPAAADASAILAVQLIAAKLNVAAGSDPDPVNAAITAADGLLSSFAGTLPYKVKPNTTAGAAMTQQARILEEYNKALLTPSCTP